MKIILTGASGFLGKAINQYFSAENIVRLGRQEGEIIADLATDIPTINKCDLVIHAAGMAHAYPKTAQEIVVFETVNVGGTANLLKGLEKSAVLPKYFVFISSIAVYGIEEGEMIDEDHPPLATDPYGKSKIKAEMLVQNWCTKQQVTCTILRLPLLAGKNPPGNLGAMIKAISKGFYFEIGKGTTKKSMLMVDDVAKFIEKIYSKGGVYNLTDGLHPSFAALSTTIAHQLQHKKPVGLPYFIVKMLALFGDLLGAKAPVNSKKLSKMTKSLTFSNHKARAQSNWVPASVIENFKI